MATKIVSGGGNIKVTAYNPDERRSKYALESDRALEDLAKRRAALQSDRTYAAQYAKAINDYVNRGKLHTILTPTPYTTSTRTATQGRASLP